ncbi:MAG: exodeoxyribonuclease VII small subunit [Candidatus Marinimicrobia bacterium]|nr:exodeoxyribonuclease VII small subunit [Candidatus Neomarinimicrobiota bacterium]
MGSKEKKGKTSFEQAMKRMSEIVKELEDGKMKLEDTLELFEEGVKLSKICREFLENAAKKVEEIKSEDKEAAPEE